MRSQYKFGIALDNAIFFGMIPSHIPLRSLHHGVAEYLGQCMTAGPNHHDLSISVGLKLSRDVSFYASLASIFISLRNSF